MSLYHKWFSYTKVPGMRKMNAFHFKWFSDIHSEDLGVLLNTSRNILIKQNIVEGDKK